jgi:prepilin-type N-terminal cleavage/methylation domain-containing protein
MPSREIEMCHGRGDRDAAAGMQLESAPASGSGYSLVEVLVALVLLGTTAAIAIPETMQAADAWRTRGAAFFMASRVALTRMQALQRQANVGLRFAVEDTGFAMRPYADGNGNGVRGADIAAGIDQPILPAERLDQLFPGAQFGFIEGATLIDGTPVAPGADPIRFGATGMLVFSPLGSSTPGSVYIRGRGRAQYAVVVLGATGRSRVLRFDFAARQWSAVE